MAVPIAAAGAAMIPGFAGGLGYGMGLQYSYARGFPAFEAGGSTGFVDVVKKDMSDMVNSFTSGIFGGKTSGSQDFDMANYVNATKPWVQPGAPKQSKSVNFTQAYQSNTQKPVKTTVKVSKPVTKSVDRATQLRNSIAEYNAHVEKLQMMGYVQGHNKYKHYANLIYKARKELHSLTGSWT